MSDSKPLIGIIMGSDSDLPIMNDAAEILKEFGIEYEIKILSAHRTPKLSAEYAVTAHERGIKVIIAGAGGAAHLPGVAAAYFPLPVIGVPIKSKYLDGLDSLLSIVQMPGGVPVATVAINQAKNAALLAVQILATDNPDLLQKVIDYKKELESVSLKKNEMLSKKGSSGFGFS
jgi:5-(carboxyamino)imidazole ribonucleotide mutase